MHVHIIHIPFVVLLVIVLRINNYSDFFVYQTKPG